MRRVVVRRVLAVLALVAGVLAGSPVPAGSAAPPPSAVGGWSWPLAGTPTATRRFEPPPGPYAAGHRGVDLAGVAGAPVLSGADGVVAFAGMVAGRPVVSVDHPGGLRTTYEPVRAVVAAGRAVARGAPLGVLLPGHAGCPVEACLHWGLRRGGIYLDPLSRLAPPRVRLLPWSSAGRHGELHFSLHGWTPPKEGVLASSRPAPPRSGRPLSPPVCAMEPERVGPRAWGLRAWDRPRWRSYRGGSVRATVRCEH